MTSAIAIQLERLLAGGPDVLGSEAAKLSALWQSLNRALEIENHTRIAGCDQELTLLLRGVLVRLARAALDSGRNNLAYALTELAEQDVPRSERRELLEIFARVKSND